MPAQNARAALDAQEILNAPPEKLTLMLYNGAIGFINDSIAAIAGGDIEKSRGANDRAQSIIRELTATLDMQYDLAKHLSSLYEYMEYNLQNAKLKNEATVLEEIKSLLTELRDAWEQAVAK